MSTDIETRLRDALAARADLVRPEDLQPATPVVELRPRPSRQSSWVLIATAAVVLLVPSLLITLAVAALSWFGIEKPALALKARALGRRTLKTIEPAAP